MKRIILSVLSVVIILASCSQEKESVRLEPGTPAYNLAKDLSEKLSALDPDKNLVLVEANNFTITTGEVIQMIYSRIGNQQNGLKSQSAEQLRQIVVSNAERMAEQKLLISAARDAGYTVSEAKLDSMMDLRARRYGSVDKYKEFLANSGISYDIMREDLRESLTIRDYLEGSIANSDQITDEEVQSAFDEKYSGDRKATVQHILLMTQGKSDAEKQEVKEKMEMILAKARGGEDFGQLAKEYSEDPGSKDRGGLYEDFERGTMVKPFEDASFNLPIGSISDIVETRYGYHIIKVLDRKKDERGVDELRSKIVDDLNKQKIDDKIKDLKESAGIELKTI